MSETRIVLVGATGLIGGEVIAQAASRHDVRLTAVARRPLDGPASVNAIVAPPAEWPRAIADTAAEVVVIALGTTWRASGRDEAAFRAVDEKLVLTSAAAARAAGATRCIAISSVGASAASGNFYLRVKGEVEAALAELGFARLDLLRPRLLRGARGGERRVGERLAIGLSPLTDALLHGPLRRYRSVEAATVARAALALASETAPGRFVYEHDAILLAAAR